jgi:hypothetical protein
VRKLIAVIVAAGLLIVCFTARGTITVAQTGAGFVPSVKELLHKSSEALRRDGTFHLQTNVKATTKDYILTTGYRADVSLSTNSYHAYYTVRFKGLGKRSSVPKDPNPTTEIIVVGKRQAERYGRRAAWSCTTISSDAASSAGIVDPSRLTIEPGGTIRASRLQNHLVWYVHVPVMIGNKRRGPKTTLDAYIERSTYRLLRMGTSGVTSMGALGKEMTDVTATFSKFGEPVQVVLPAACQQSPAPVISDSQVLATVRTYWHDVTHGKLDAAYTMLTSGIRAVTSKRAYEHSMAGFLKVVGAISIVVHSPRITGDTAVVAIDFSSPKPKVGSLHAYQHLFREGGQWRIADQNGGVSNTR